MTPSVWLIEKRRSVRVYIAAGSFAFPTRAAAMREIRARKLYGSQWTFRPVRYVPALTAKKAGRKAK